MFVYKVLFWITFIIYLVNRGVELIIIMNINEQPENNGITEKIDFIFKDAKVIEIGLWSGFKVVLAMFMASFAGTIVGELNVPLMILETAIIVIAITLTIKTTLKITKKYW